MSSMKRRRGLAAIVVVALSGAGFASLAQADIVETEALVQTPREANLSAIRGQLARQDVQTKLAGFGVSPEAIDQRLASLSDAELATLSARMGEAPAGGDGVLAVIGIAFVVLLILEAVGVIDIFKKFP